MTVTFESSTLATPPANTVIASDTIGGIDFQRVKLAWGTTGTANDVSTDNAFPVNIVSGSGSGSTSIDVKSLPSPLGWLTSSTGTGVPLIGAVNLTSGTQTIGTVLGSFSISSSTINIGAVQQGTSPWVTSIASSTATIGNVLGSFSISSSTLPIGGVYLSSSPSTGTPFIIGSVAPSSQWTVTTTPSSRVPVDVNSLPSVTLTSGAQVIGAVNQGTSPWTVAQTSSTGFLGSVAVTSGTVTLTSGTLALGTVTLSSGTQTIGTVNQGGAPWSVSLTSGTLALGSVTATLSSGTQTIGTVLQGSAPWSVSVTSSTALKGVSFAAYASSDSSAVIVSTTNALPVSAQPFSITTSTANVGSVSISCSTLTVGSLLVSSGTQTIGTVIISSGTQTIGSVIQTSGTLNLGRMEDAVSSVMMSSGNVVQPVQANVTTSSSFALIFTAAAAGTLNRIVAAAISVSSSTAAIFGGTFMTSAAVALSGKFFQPVSPSNTVVLSFNPMGWAQTTTTAIYYQSGVLVSTAVSVSVTYMPL